MISSQEKNMEAEEPSTLVLGVGKDGSKTDLFEKGKGFSEAVVSRVTTDIQKLDPSPAPWLLILPS